MAHPDDYQSRIGAAVLQTIFDASIVEEDGQPTAFVDSTLAAAALINVMALLLESGSGCETPKQMRELTEGIGRKLLAEMRALRATTEATGARAFDTNYGRTN